MKPKKILKPGTIEQQIAQIDEWLWTLKSKLRNQTIGLVPPIFVSGYSKDIKVKPELSSFLCLFNGSLTRIGVCFEGLPKEGANLVIVVEGDDGMTTKVVRVATPRYISNYSLPVFPGMTVTVGVKALSEDIGLPSYGWLSMLFQPTISEVRTEELIVDSIEKEIRRVEEMLNEGV